MASVFSVKYLGAERKLTRDQLEKAPESLLSIILLGKDTGLVDHNALEIPSRDNAPQLAAWQAGNADLFQVCMDCYLSDSERVLIDSPRTLQPAVELISALDFFNIDDKLRPPAIRMASKALLVRQDHKVKLRRLVAEAVLLMEGEFDSKRVSAQRSMAKHPSTNFCFRNKHGELRIEKMGDPDHDGDSPTHVAGYRCNLSDLEQQELHMAAQALQMSAKFKLNESQGCVVMCLSYEA